MPENCDRCWRDGHQCPASVEVEDPGAPGKVERLCAFCDDGVPCPRSQQKTALSGIVTPAAAPRSRSAAKETIARVPAERKGGKHGGRHPWQKSAPLTKKAAISRQDVEDLISALRNLGYKNGRAVAAAEQSRGADFDARLKDAIRLASEGVPAARPQSLQSLQSEEEATMRKRMCACNCGQPLPDHYDPTTTVIWGHAKNMKKAAAAAPAKSRANGHANGTNGAGGGQTATITVTEGALDGWWQKLRVDLKAQAFTMVMSQGPAE